VWHLIQSLPMESEPPVTFEMPLNLSGQSQKLGALMGADCLVPRPADSKELNAAKQFAVGLSLVLNQLQDLEWAFNDAKIAVDVVAETIEGLRARGRLETFRRMIIGSMWELVAFLDDHLVDLELWPPFTGCVATMLPPAQAAWGRLRDPPKPLRRLLHRVRNKGAFHVASKDIALGLDRFAKTYPGPFMAQAILGSRSDQVRFCYADLAVGTILSQAEQVNSLTQSDVSAFGNDIEALATSLLPNVL
jgi:hypothetical protein